MPLPYKKDDEESKRKFFESYRDVYRAYGMSEKDIDEFIAKRVNDNSAAEKEYESANEVIETERNHKQVSKKYGEFAGHDNSVFTRLIQAITKPETSIENIKYNEMIARKLQTRDGIVEILQDEISMLLNADENLFSGKPSYKEMIDNLNVREVGFIAPNICEVLTDFRKELNITEEEIPASVEKYFRDNHAFYILASTQRLELNRAADELMLALPDIDEIYKIDGIENIDDKDEIHRLKDARNIKVIPDIVTRIGKLNKTGSRDKAFTDNLTTVLLGNLAGNVRNVTEHLPEKEPDVQAFVDRIQVRMANDIANVDTVTEEFKAKEDVNNFLVDKSTLLHYGTDNPKVSASTFTKNQKLYNNTVDALKPGILDSYKNKSYKDIIEDVYQALQKGVIEGRVNKNYDTMLESATTLREMLQEKNPDKIDNAKFIKELNTLQLSSRLYLAQKFRDTSTYSQRALNRIAAASLAGALGKGLTVRATLEGNAEKLQGVRLDYGRDYNFREAKTLFQGLNEAFKENPTPVNFARALTAESVFEQLNLDKDMTMNGDSIKEMMTANMQIYTKLCEEDPRFAEAIKSGDYKKTMADINEIKRDMSTRMYADRLYRNELGMDSYKIEATGNNKINTPRSVKAEEEPKVQKAPNVPNVPQ